MLKGKCRKNSKCLKYVTLCCLGIVLGIGVLLWYPFKTGYYSSIAVTFGRYDYPFVTTELQNRSFALAVDVGGRFPLALRREMLDEITDKESHGTITVRYIGAQEREVPSYLIPQLKVGDLTLENVIAHEAQEDYGTLGMFLGGEFNLLVDFPHSRIIACDTFAKLQAKKLADRYWIRTPFEMHRGGIVFHVGTDFGTRRLAINATSTRSFFDSSVLPPQKSCASSSFLLGGQQFGNITFESMDLPEGLREIDGFIGMDFLKEYAIYLDYTHKIAYVEPPKKYFERIPVTFVSGDPTIDVCVEGNVYPLKLDLGNFFPFAFREEILENIRKFKYGTATWHDFSGKKYESPAYSIPEIKINNLRFTHVLAKKDREDFHVNATLQGPPMLPLGVIGLPIIEKYNLLLDFPHSAIYVSNDRLSLQQAGLLSRNLLAAPFVRHQDGILLSIGTDTGIYRLILDTGATRTFIRTPHPTLTEKFRILEHNFGERSVASIDLSPQFDYDGFLGMDFLCEYSVFIDYPNKMIYIDLQNRNNGAAR